MLSQTMARSVELTELAACLYFMVNWLPGSLPYWRLLGDCRVC